MLWPSARVRGYELDTELLKIGVSEGFEINTFGAVPDV